MKDDKMTDGNKKNSSKSDGSTHVCDEAIALNHRASPEGRDVIANESFRNYSEVDRDVPPPPPHK